MTSLASAADSVAVTVTGEPSATGFGDADRLTAGTSPSVIVTATVFGLPAVTVEGSVLPSATMNVSSSVSVSSVVVIRPVPVVDPGVITMLVSEPRSSASAVRRVTLTGIATWVDRVAESVAVTVTGEPSSTGFGEADRLTDAAGPQLSAALINSILTVWPPVHAR